MNKIRILIIFLIFYATAYANNFEYITSFDEHKSSIGCITISDNSKYLITGSFDTTIKIWELKTKKAINTIIHGAILESLTISKDNRLIASIGRDKFLKIWDFDTGNLIQTSGPFNDFLFSVTFSPDNKNVLIGSYKYIYFLNIKNNKITKKLDIGNIWARNIKFSPDNNFFGVCGGNEMIIYKARQNTDFISKISGKTLDFKKISTYKTHSYIYSFDFSLDSQYFAFGNEEGEIYLHRTIDGLLMWNKKLFNSLIWSISFSNQNILAVSGRDNDILLLDIWSGNIIEILKTECNENFSVVFSNNNRYLAASGKDAKVRLWHNKKTNFLIFKKEYFFVIIAMVIIIVILLLLIKRK